MYIYTFVSCRNMDLGNTHGVEHQWCKDFSFLPWHRRIWKCWQVKRVRWQVMSWKDKFSSGDWTFTVFDWYFFADFFFGWICLADTCLCRIFALATVLSSVLIYNLPETVSDSSLSSALCYLSNGTLKSFIFGFVLGWKMNFISHSWFIFAGTHFSLLYVNCIEFDYFSFIDTWSWHISALICCWTRWRILWKVTGFISHRIELSQFIMSLILLLTCFLCLDLQSFRHL